MVANKRYQIFVSSTQADLRDEREAIINALTKIGYIAVGMEQFPATDEEQMDFIRPVIDESDYYIVVVKARYGSLAADGVSYTEKEFRYAVEQKKPAMAFLYKDVSQLRVGDTDNDPEKMSKLRIFRAELESKRIVKHWVALDELVAQVKDSVNDMVRRKPAIGWIRGDQALDPSVYVELENLRKENARLVLANKSSGSIFPMDIAHGEDEIEIPYIITFYKKDPGNIFISKVERTEEKSIKLNCDRILIVLRDLLYDEASEWLIANSLSSYFAESFEPQISEMQDESAAIYVRLSLPTETVAKLRFHFEALSLLSARQRMNPQKGDSEWCWGLTDIGRRYVAKLNAFKKQ